ncbi:translation initiation factor IF-2 [Pleurocapsales cyanobacterium LEGE 06147]|nr:translation initiation factor IF-2 [Pleurocapsales cyanobacterium LEGE 06147]
MNNGKVRIYELSKELNLDNKDIKEICEQLNIAVKSHSSTITSAQAERVRAAAVKYIPEKMANKVTEEEKEKSSPSSLGSPKQQILAVHHKQTSSHAASQANKAEHSVTPVLSAPPQRPSKSQSTNSLESQFVAKPKSKETPESPEKVKPIEEKIEEKIENREEREPVANSPAAEKPKLIGPPPRPQASKPITQKTVQPPSPKLTRAAAIPSPVSRTEALEETQSKEATSPVTSRQQQPAPKLQRPQRPKPADELRPEPDEVVTFDQQETGVEEEDTELDLADKNVNKLKLKRPSTPPRKAKGKEWQEEEDEEETLEIKASKAKAGVKGKRRPKPLLDDEDEDFENELDTVHMPTAVSLSIARPPKPKSLEQTQPATSSGVTKAKKPTPKAEKTEKTERRDRQVVNQPPEKIVIANDLTVRELAELLQTPETEIIKNLFFKGMAVNITQTLDIDTARLVAEELGVKVETAEEKSAAVKDTEMLDVEDLENLQHRPPVVTIMGHVDHGKTTLLDSIRKSKVAQGEAGGITQHIGAYHVDLEHNGKQQQIVFLDTPGHEAFTAMRARGTRVTDIAILVVAADDGVQPQTREAISHARAAEVPIVVAINKVDKPEANQDRIKQELAEQGLVPEDWGGDTIMVPVSALKGDNLDNLLEMILLVAEIEELSANPNRPAKGTVIEANLDRARGPVATLLVQNGTLRVGDIIVAGSVFGKIRAMVDDRGDKVEAVTPSFPVEILGLGDVPEAGDEFQVYDSEKEARAVAEKRAARQRHSRLQQAMSSRRVSLSSLSAQAQEGELKELNLLLKADVQGSVEAILGALQQLPQDEVQVRVLLAAPGEVTETDVDLAAASGAVIIGFNTTLASGARQAADREGVDIRQYNIIYKLLDDIQGAMEGLLEPEEVEETLGQAQVRAVFPVGRGAVAGCYVQSGKIVRNCQMRVRRGNQVVYKGTLDSLKRVKEDAREVNAGYECGIGSSKFQDWQEGDIIEAYQMAYKRRTLSSANSR